MAIFNIATSSGYELPSASWVNNDPTTRPKPLQYDEGPECENAHFPLVAGCNVVYGDRFAISGKLRSGSINTVKSNSNDINAGNPELSIRIVEDNSAIRANYYHEVYGTFVSGFPQSVLYYLPQQTVSTVYATSTKWYGHINPTRNIVEVERDQFLPSNYKDKFSSKNVVLIANSGNIDYNLSQRLNTLVYILGCSAISEPSCNGRIYAYFIRPTGTDNSFDSYYDYQTYENIGLAFNNITNGTFEDSIKIFNVNYSGQIILSVVYDSLYANTEIAVKHPLIDSDYLLFNLSSDDQTNINLEDYQ